MMVFILKMYVKKIYSNIYARVCVCVLFAQSCPTPCKSTDCNPPGSSVHGFSRQEYWSGLPCPPPGDLPDPRIKPGSLVLQADSLLSEPPWKPIYAHISTYISASMYDKYPKGGNGNPFRILVWKIPWTEKPHGLQPKGSQRVRQD